MINYDLFLSDFDGTLVRSDGTVSERARRAIEDYRARGGIFAVCTGRMLTSILPRVRELGIEEGLVAAYQGALIADVKTGKLLKNEGFSPSGGVRALKILEKECPHVHMYTQDALFSNKKDELLDIYEKICGVKAEIVSEMPLSEKAEREGLRIVKALAMCSPSKHADILRRVSEAAGDAFYVTGSSDWLVEIMPHGQNKESAARFLSEYYSVPMQRVAAIGDQLNDLPMIAAVGGKFAVANAAEALKKIACTVPSNEEDGVAFALEHYVMRKSYE